jgi:hypothetical protein
MYHFAHIAAYYQSRQSSVLAKAYRFASQERTIPSPRCSREPSRHRQVSMIGKTFGRWTVKEVAERKNHLVCECTCGTIKIVRTNSLRDGTSLSCGCLHREIVRQQMKNLHIKNNGRKLGRIGPETIAKWRATCLAHNSHQKRWITRRANAKERGLP